jgi:predicted Ser/Thr protein kinase
MNLFNGFRRSKIASSHRGGAQMTWASRTLSSSLSQTRLFLKRQLWIWPIIAVLFLSILGWAVQRSIESTMKANLESELQTLLKVQSAMLETWLATQEANAESMANDGETRRMIAELIDAPAPAAGSLAVATDKRSTAEQLGDSLAPALESHDYDGFFIADRTQTIRASSETELVGLTKVPAYQEFLTKALDGATNVSRPFPSVAVLKFDDNRRTGMPTMFVAAPVLDENLQVVAALALRIRPDREFTRVLGLGQVGDSGETYAFDKDGLLLSNSRFNDQLVLLGILPEKDGDTSMLNVLVRDPGGNLTTGHHPSVRRSKLPVTKMVAAARDGAAGVDVEGYRDYRGVPVVGAWDWFPKYGFGVATEVDQAEAFGPLNILKRTFWALLGLLVLCSIAIFIFTLMVARLQRQARAAAIEAKQLGQYKLEQKLGEGAMGVVYKGQHAMLRRPTAIKLLDADKVTDESIVRFEREVQITSQLSHPNTVAIYDYGRTPEGVFYYAMEYIEGIDLQALVDQYGPQPPARVIHLLRQICGSLYEAHSKGMVHRDIKPANLMLTRRGGESDVVKVLDFGLVKARDEEGGEKAAGLAGTPLYMSPEAIQMPASVDACSDLYAVGAVGYFLLTGYSVFEASSVVELCQKHINEPPTPPSERLGKPLPLELETAILACLEKSRAKRPQTARDLAQRLERCNVAVEWTVDYAESWWSQHDRGRTPVVGHASSTTANEYAATIAHK